VGNIAYYSPVAKFGKIHDEIGFLHSFVRPLY